MNRLLDEGAGEARRLKLNLLRSHELETSRLRSELIALLPSERNTEAGASKDAIRIRHHVQRAALLTRMQRFLGENEELALAQFASGTEVDPSAIAPAVSLVTTDADGRLFSYATLHWSVPVSGGYGRRSRFLVRDRQNGKLIGVFALSDPVYNLRSRDQEIGWDDKRKRIALYRVMDASVIGALPPYRELLGGKLVALAAISRETLDLIAGKYNGSQTNIKQRVLSDTKPLVVTTTSALGRSSLYNRLRRPDRVFYRSIGWTEGYGHFEVPETLFQRLLLLLEESGYAKARSNAYGMGPSWRMRTIRAGLEYLRINPNLALKHGIKREVFLAPTARNWRGVLAGAESSPDWFDDELAALSAFYRERWAVPRAKTRDEYRAFRPESMRLRNNPHVQQTLVAAE
jgi:hypothetical protein